MNRQDSILASLNELGLAPEAQHALKELLRESVAGRPDILDTLAALPPGEGPGGRDAPAESVAWGLRLLEDMLKTGEAPLACLWVALHFAEFTALRAVWASPGTQAPPISPFVYAMQ